MLSTKIRTTIIALVAAFSLAGVALVPTGAHAMGIKIISTACQTGQERTVDTTELRPDGFHTKHEVQRCSGGKWRTIEVGFDREAAPPPPSNSPVASLPGTGGSTPPSNSTKLSGSPLPAAL
jgi:hypothetical protein